MTGSPTDVARAQAEAAAAKARFGDTLAEFKHRIDPRVKARQTFAELREHGREASDDALEFAYEKPRAVAAGAAALTLLVLRKPLWRLGNRLFRRAKPAPASSTATITLRKNSTGRLVSLPGKGGETR